MSTLDRSGRGSLARKLKLVAILGGLGTVIVFLANLSGALSLFSFFRTEALPLTPPLAAELEAALRDEHLEQPEPGPARDARLERALAAFLLKHKVSREEAELAAGRFARQMELAEGSLTRGLDLFAAGRLEDAAREFESATRTDPANSLAWSNLGAARMKLGRVEEARKAYDQALLLAPEDWRIRYNFGLSLARTGSAREALGYLQPALEVLRADEPRQSLLAQVELELRTDPGLLALRNEPGFENLLAGR